MCDGLMWRRCDLVKVQSSLANHRGERSTSKTSKFHLQSFEIVHAATHESLDVQLKQLPFTELTKDDLERSGTLQPLSQNANANASEYLPTKSLHVSLRNCYSKAGRCSLESNS